MQVVVSVLMLPQLAHYFLETWPTVRTASTWAMSTWIHRLLFILTWPELTLPKLILLLPFFIVHVFMHPHFFAIHGDTLTLRLVPHICKQFWLPGVIGGYSSWIDRKIWEALKTPLRRFAWRSCLMMVDDGIIEIWLKLLYWAQLDTDWTVWGVPKMGVLRRNAQM